MESVPPTTKAANLGRTLRALFSGRASDEERFLPGPQRAELV